MPLKSTGQQHMARQGAMVQLRASVVVIGRRIDNAPFQGHPLVQPPRLASRAPTAEALRRVRPPQKKINKNKTK